MLEGLLYQQLNEEILGLPRGDRRRLVWTSLDAFACAPVTAQPVGYAKCPPAEWVEITAKYLGMPSPALRAFQGQVIHGTTARVDACGDTLTSACLPHDQYASLRHDPIVRLLAAFARDFARTYADVEPYWSIASAVQADPRARAAFAQRHPGQRLRSFVPDVILFLGDMDRLIEVKTIHVNPTWYGSHYRARRAAVNKRAAGLQVVYLRKAARLDEELFGTPAGQSGPIQDKLRSFGPIIPVVSGAFGEVSDAGHQLVDTMAGMGARAWQARLDSPSVQDAKAFLKHHMTMQLGMQGARGNARLLLHRLQFINSCGGRRYPRHCPPGGTRTGEEPPGSYGADNACRGERIRRACGRRGGCSFASRGGGPSRRAGRSYRCDASAGFGGAFADDE